MDEESYLGRYILSNDSLEKLKEIEELLKEKGQFGGSDAWRIIHGEPEETAQDEVEENQATETNNEQCFPEPFKVVAKDKDQDTVQATQFLLTQNDHSHSQSLTQDGSQLTDITECLYEVLERNNGKLDLSLIQNLTDFELMEILDDMSKKLSPKGVFNLCHSICVMGIEERMRYVGLICSNLLLPMLINVENSSKFIDSAIIECVEKFPEEIKELVFIPILNADLKDTSAILAIVNSFNGLKKQTLISDYSITVRDLKEWHVLILQNLLTPNLDDNTKDRLIKLLLDKSVDLCNDKNYGKLLLNLLKTNAPFTEQQILSLGEIATLNNTLFKKSLENVLRTLKSNS